MDLTNENIENVLVDCFYQDSEIVDGQIPSDIVKVEGIMTTWGFNPERLKKHKGDIREMLSELPDEFTNGGGQSFLQACMNKNGEQWTGLHEKMDKLFSLGQAVGLVESCLPRNMWSILPGGMPYYVVKLD